MNNENLKEIFGVTKNQISRIVSRLQQKGYTSNKYIYKNNHKEILYRQITSIRKNDDTYRQKIQYRYNKKVQQGILKNDKVLKDKNNNYKKYNNIRNYEGRNYSPEDFETLYANL